MIIVIPMAGLGTRFQDGRETKQKSLIRCKGITLLEYSIRSLPVELASEMVFVMRSEQAEEELTNLISKLCVDVPYRIVSLDSQTQGQAESVYLGLQHIKRDESILIHNCDTALNAAWNFKTGASALFFAFTSNSPSYSYARLNSRGSIIEMAEKKVISRYASSGTYWFDSLETYIRFYKNYVLEFYGKELYVVPIMQLMIQSNMRIDLVKCNDVFPLGTPEDLLASGERIFKWNPHW